MTTQQDRIALRETLEQLIGADRTATLWVMLHDRDELATRADLRAEMGSLRDELRSEMTALRGEMAALRGEMAALRGDMNSFVRTFIAAQAATIVAVSGIVYGLVRLT